MKPYEFTKVELPLRADESLYHIPMQKYSVNKKGEIILKFNEAWPNTPETLVLHLTGKVLRLQPLIFPRVYCLIHESNSRTTL